MRPHPSPVRFSREGAGPSHLGRTGDPRPAGVIPAPRAGAGPTLSFGSDLLDIVAHDLRAPLAALATASELLVEDVDVLDRA